MTRNFDHVLAKNAGGNQCVFRVCAVVEYEILAQIGPALPAEEAFVTRSGVRRNHAHTWFEAIAHSRARLFDDSSHFMAEDRRRHDHARVVTLFPDLQIGATRKRDLDSDQEIVRADGRDRHFLDLQIFAAVQHGRHHVSVALAIHGNTITFKEFCAG